MPVSQIAGVVLRLIAIRWLFDGVMLGISGGFMALNFPGSAEWLRMLSYVISPVVLIAMSFLIWWFADAIGRVVAGKSDPVVLNGTIRREDLFSVGMLVMGLWFALTYFGNSLNWLHYMIAAKDFGSRIQSGDTSILYEVVKTVAPCFAGILITLNAASIGRRLAQAGPAAKREGGETSVG